MYTKRTIIVSIALMLVFLLSTTVWNALAASMAAPGNTYESTIIRGEGLEW